MWTTVIALGFTQTIAWASSTYLIAIVAQPAAHDLGISGSTVFGAFSLSLVTMALAGPAVGRLIDKRGGRVPLALSNVVLSIGLAMLAWASNVALLFAAWMVLGVGMALGLYDAAFAALVRVFGTQARGPITGITLIAGFASTVGWPLSAFITEQYGWRATCLAWVALHMLVALPMNLLLTPGTREANRKASSTPPERYGTAPGRRLDHGHQRVLVLVTVFASMAAFVTSAMAAHLPGLLRAAGTPAAAALTAAALVGPAQVAARFIEFLAAQRFRFHPLITARTAVALHPAGALLLVIWAANAFAASAFAVLHGAGNGMVTIARGTLPLAMFGAAGYGERQGVIGVAARSMQAAAPFAFGIALERFGFHAALGLTIACSIVAFVALLMSCTPAD